jgi:type I restriction enzyme R subunit
MERFQALIDAYNAGSINVEEFFKRLVEFTDGLKEEDQRAIAESLADEELAVFDLLTKPHIQLNTEERDQVKKLARELLATLEEEKLVLDWRKKQQTRASVKVTISRVLDQLPKAFEAGVWHEKVGRVPPRLRRTRVG